MRFNLFFVFFVIVGLSTFCQISFVQKKEISFRRFRDIDFYKTVKNSGVVLVAKIEGNKKVFFWDKDLNIIWQNRLPQDYNNFSSVLQDNGLVLYNHNFNSFKLTFVDLKEDEISFYGKLKFKAFIDTVLVLNDNPVLLLSKGKHRFFMIFCKGKISLKTVFEQERAWLKKVEVSQEGGRVFLFYNKKDGGSNVKVYDTTLVRHSDYLLFEDKKIQDVCVLVGADGHFIFAGSYGSSEKIADGIFFARIKNGKLSMATYELSDIKNFFNFAPSLSMRQKKHYPALLVFQPIMKIGDKYCVVADNLEPIYSYEDDDYDMFTKKFDGYDFKNSIILMFDAFGHLMWDAYFDYDLPLSKLYKPQSITLFNEKILTVLVANDEKLYFKTIGIQNGREINTGEITLDKFMFNEKEKGHLFSDLEKLSNTEFVVMGKKRLIKNTKKYKSFFILKGQLN